MRIKESGHKIIDLKSPNDSSVRFLLTSLVCVMCVELGVYVCTSGYRKGWFVFHYLVHKKYNKTNKVVLGCKATLPCATTL